MNKDALLATLIGFGIGLLITGVLLAGPNLAKMFPAIKLPPLAFLNQKKETINPTPTPSQTGFSLTIDSPLADAIENKEELLVSGTAAPGAMVVIQGPVDEVVVVTKDDGKYAGKVTLMEGKNDITVSASQKDKQTSQTVTIYYTPEEL